MFVPMSTEIREVSQDEKRWLTLLSEGKSISEVAKEVKLAKGTFAYKLNMLKERLGCKNMASLMYFVAKNEVI